MYDSVELVGGEIEELVEVNVMVGELQKALFLISVALTVLYLSAIITVV